MINSSVKDELRPRLLDYVSQITTPSRKAGHNMYVCPLCGSGSHGGRNSDGAFHADGERWYCHSCQRGGDVFSLYAEMNQLNTSTDFPKVVEGLAQALGVTVIDSAKRDFSTEVRKEEKKEVKPEVKSNPEREKQIERFSSALAGSPAETYLKERGFSDEIIKKYRLGYDRAKNAVVIPYPGTDYFTKRLIAPAEDQKKYDNLPGEAPTFMIGEPSSEYWIITEGQLDALSIIQAGAKNVIASHYPSRLKEWLNEEIYIPVNGVLDFNIKPRYEILKGVAIVGDRDPEEKRDEKDGLTPGERQAQKIAEIFTERKIKSITVFPPEGFKDSNDILRADQKQLTKLLTQWEKELFEKPDISEEEEEGRDINVQDYLTGDGFDSDIEYFRKYKDRKIGFENLDKYVTLYPGVACLGGASSLGKTTFAVNVVDNLLKRGESVIYFVLEQLPIELVSKSLARRMYEIDQASPIDNIDIMNGASSDALVKAKADYAQTAQKYRIVEGDFHFSMKKIRDYVEAYIEDTGIRPIVVIDYLQLIAPPEGFRGTEREKIDYNLKEIKDMSKKNELFVLLISSFNRASYKEPVSMESFKESGMIEYTCDYIFGLQLSILEDSDFYTTTGSRGGERDNNNDKKEKMLYEAINKAPKEVELVALKNRRGRQRFKCFFKYEMRFDTFTPDMNSPYDKDSPSSDFKKVTSRMNVPFKTV